MASIARVCRITGITELYEEIGSEDMKSILQSVDKGLVAQQFGGLQVDEEEDEGVIVRRNE